MNVLSTIGQLSGYSSLDLAGAAGQLATVIIYQGFSREQESDADHKGINYAHKAGYNPEAMASLFEKLLKKEKEEGNHGTLVILSAHPALQQRIANVKKWGRENKQSEDK
jgi:predicted Zn-dependent protease